MNGDDHDDNIVTLVRNNLLHYQLWNEVHVSDETLLWKDRKIKLISGKPPSKLSNDDENEGVINTEYVLPVEMSQYKVGYLTLECLDTVFNMLCDPAAKRLTLAIVNSDGTVVFYFVYKGIHKPKRN